MATPMMKQYAGIKSSHPDEILLFRMGDFYETFYDDARTVSRVLGLTLTSREKDRDTGQPIPLAGFPYHALDDYLTRLVRAGLRVAICEQTGDAPSLSRGLVERSVVEVVSAGTLIGGSALPEKESALLCAMVTEGGGVTGIATCDLSVGRLEATETASNEAASEISRLSPRELVVPEGALDNDPPEGCSLTLLEPWKFEQAAATESILEQFGLATLEGIGLEGRTAATRALGGLLQYVRDTKRSTLGHLAFRGFYRRSDEMYIDRSSAEDLEIVPVRAKTPPGSSLWEMLDLASTAAGSRCLREWLLRPPFDPEETASRLDAVEALLDESTLDPVRDILSRTTDLQRQAGRLAAGRSGPRDLRAIAETASVLPGLRDILSDSASSRLNGLSEMDPLGDLADRIGSTLSEAPPLRVSDGGAIADGVDEELDRLRETVAGGRRWITDLESRERESTGISKLSVGFNKVFGYYLEVPRSQLEMVPERYARKQTLVNAERFVTAELKDMESRVLSADERILAMERTIFDSLRDLVAAEAGRVRDTGRAIAALDVLCSFAACARDRGYVKPSLVAAGDGAQARPVLCIESGRHPLLDRLLPPGECVPNDLRLDDSRRILIVTGPNMAGKSTFLRQAALLTVMAQTGSFVPAAAMAFTPVDQLFTRIGSSDRITRGHSTFLVEMAEAARVLNTSSRRSLAILDELGRGTSTFDGLSLAWSMIEYLHDHERHRPLVLFATHYHELTALADRLEAVFNVNVTVRETGSGVVFLFRVKEGGTDRSYGIHVASMAGVPRPVRERAAEVLGDLEHGRHLDARHLDGSPAPAPSPQLSLSFEDSLDESMRSVLEMLGELDPDALSPRQAMLLVYELKALLERGGED